MSERCRWAPVHLYILVYRRPIRRFFRKSFDLCCPVCGSVVRDPRG